MSRSFRPAAALTALAMLPALAIPVGALDVGLDISAPDACVAGPVADAAVALHGANTEVLDVAVDTALVSVPVVHPGMNQRLLSAGADIWCPASAINVVQAGITDAVAQARGAASVLAAANFDGVTITDSAEVSPGVVELTTHARTNGIVADWTITVDDLGIVDASWTATEFAVQPFEAQYEGFTALPGAQIDYARNAAGLVEVTTPIMADPLGVLAEQPAAAEAPGPFMANEMSDGFTVYVNVGDQGYFLGTSGSLGVAPDPDVDSGDDQVDYLRLMSRAAVDNYEDFLGWGFEQTAGQGAAAPGWNDDEGTIYVDGAYAAVCLACVFISEDFNVQMSRALHEALTVLGYSYPDDSLAVINIVGHEILHNWQNAYGKPSSIGGGRHRAFSEGTARFSESLHDYSHVSHQPGSLIYANDSNGCNGFNTNDAGFAGGPLDGLGYHACQFWLAHYAEHGLDAIAGLWPLSAGLPEGSEFETYDDAIVEAAGVPMEDILANFAARTITHEGYLWGNPVNPETQVLDWAEPGLERWTPASSHGAGSTFSASLGRGGVAATRLTSAVTITSIRGGSAAVAHPDGSHTMLDVGGTAAAGEHLVLINPTDSTGVAVSATLG